MRLFGQSWHRMARYKEWGLTQPALCSITKPHRDCAVHLTKRPRVDKLYAEKGFNFGYRFLWFINQTQMQPFSM